MNDEEGVLAGEVVPLENKKHYPVSIYQTPKADIAAKRRENAEFLRNALNAENKEAAVAAPAVENKPKRKASKVDKFIRVEAVATPARKTVHILDIATQGSIKLPVVDVGRGEHCWQILFPLGDMDYVPALNAQLRATYEFPDGSITEDLIYLGGSATLYSAEFSVLTLHRMC